MAIGISEIFIIIICVISVIIFIAIIIACTCNYKKKVKGGFVMEQTGGIIMADQTWINGQMLAAPTAIQPSAGFTNPHQRHGGPTTTVENHQQPSHSFGLATSQQTAYSPQHQHSTTDTTHTIEMPSTNDEYTALDPSLRGRLISPQQGIGTTPNQLNNISQRPPRCLPRPHDSNYVTPNTQPYYRSLDGPDASGFSDGYLSPIPNNKPSTVYDSTDTSGFSDGYLSPIPNNKPSTVHDSTDGYLTNVRLYSTPSTDVNASSVEPTSHNIPSTSGTSNRDQQNGCGDTHPHIYDYVAPR